MIVKNNSDAVKCKGDNELGCFPDSFYSTSKDIESQRVKTVLY